LAAVSGLCLAGYAQAAEPSAEARIQQLEAKIAALEARQASSSRDLAATIDGVLRDAEKRSQLLQNTASMSAGYDDGFFLRSGDNFVMRPGVLLQFRHNINGSDDADGDSDVENGFEVRHLQLSFAGTVINPDLTYYFEWDTATEGGSVNLNDAWARWMFNDQMGLRLGQFKVPVSHEQLLSDGRLLAADRSLADTVFVSNTVNRSQGVALVLNGYDPDSPFNAEIAFHDGAGEANTNFVEDDADWGFAARVEFKAFGNWTSYSDFSAMRNRESLLVIGAGGDWSQSGDSDLLTGAIDAQWETGNGLGVFGALLLQNIEPGGDADDFTNFGLVAQAGYLLNPSWELFGRWDAIFADDDIPVGGGDEEDTFHEFTVGVNYFLGDNGSAGHRAKFTVDFSFLPDGAPGAIQELGYIGGNGEDEWLIRGQFQLWI
jgi:hypothetical protein